MVYRIFLYVSIGNVFNLMVLGWKIVMFMEVVLFYLWERVDVESVEIEEYVVDLYKKN